MIWRKKCLGPFLACVIFVLMVGIASAATSSAPSTAGGAGTLNTTPVAINNDVNNDPNAGIRQRGEVITPPVGLPNGGVFINADGVLASVRLVPGPLPVQQTTSALPSDIARKSEMRLISLNRLEQAIIDNNGKITEEMRYLCGILRLKYVFFYEETGDIVVGGPAEGWTVGRDGAIVGQSTGLPVLELEDLVVALRAYPANGSKTGVVGCSIDPTTEGLARMQAFTRNFGPMSSNPYEAEQQKVRFVNGIRETLGYHDIRVDGIAPNTHLAQILVAADYRMKLIGLGFENPGVRMATYIANANPASMGNNALIRWYFVPDYECVKKTDDGNAIEFVGNGVKLVDEAEMVKASGERRSAGRTNRASQQFVKSFTSQYPKIARAAPVYAQLRNVIDMLVCAAHIQKEGFYEKSGWSMEYLGCETNFPTETYRTPERVDSVVARVDGSNGTQFGAPVSGGVVIQPENALDTNLAKASDKQLIEKTKERVRLDLAPGQWWWDVDLKK
ncbi:MAG: DUF1598 domain-containing protein [Planctomycetaceae bacterium]|nr:DUF1598 domain-containing protein [Planctomycetaceae bacterium]